MQYQINIETGSLSFTKKELNTDILQYAISEVLDQLGIDATIKITTTTQPDFLVINKKVCRFPAFLEEEVDSYVLSVGAVNEKNSILFWKLFVKSIVWMQPHVLFTAEMLPEYIPAIRSLKDDKKKEAEKKCLEIIYELLNLKISIGNKALIETISSRHINKPEIEWNDFREELINELSGKEILIYFNRGYFDEVIISGNKENMFHKMRDDLFYQTGIYYPPFKICFDASLPYNAFFFSVNSFTAGPVAGLNSNEIFVNDTPERLKLEGIAGRPTLNPVNNLPGCIIDKSEAGLISKAISVLDGVEFFILCFQDFLQKYGYLTLNKAFALQYLIKLKPFYLKTVELTEEKNLISITTKIFRLLARDGISIRNQPAILDAILESSYIIADDCKYIIFDERVACMPGFENDWKSHAENIIEFVRTRLKRYISYKYSKGQTTLIVYLLDPEIEQMVSPAENADAATVKKIIAAVDSEFANLPLSSNPPLILTTASIRSQVKSIIEKRYPQATVLSYQELSPELNIQPIARITLD